MVDCCVDGKEGYPPRCGDNFSMADSLTVHTSEDRQPTASASHSPPRHFLPHPSFNLVETTRPAVAQIPGCKLSSPLPYRYTYNTYIHSFVFVCSCLLSRQRCFLFEKKKYLPVKYVFMSQAGVASAPVETLLPYQSCVYSWDEPMGDRSLIVERLVPTALADSSSTSSRSSSSSSSRFTPAVAAAAAVDGTVASSPSVTGDGFWRPGPAQDAAIDGRSTMVGVYGLDLVVPSATVGNLRVGECPDELPLCTVELLWSC